MTHTMDLGEVRREYESHRLHKREMDADPIVQFGLWLQQIRTRGSNFGAEMFRGKLTAVRLPADNMVNTVVQSILHLDLPGPDG